MKRIQDVPKPMHGRVHHTTRAFHSHVRFGCECCDIQCLALTVMRLWGSFTSEYALFMPESTVLSINHSSVLRRARQNGQSRSLRKQGLQLQQGRDIAHLYDRIPVYSLKSLHTANNMRRRKTSTACPSPSLQHET